MSDRRDSGSRHAGGKGRAYLGGELPRQLEHEARPRDGGLDVVNQFREVGRTRAGRPGRTELGAAGEFPARAGFRRDDVDAQADAFHLAQRSRSREPLRGQAAAYSMNRRDGGRGRVDDSLSRPPQLRQPVGMDRRS